MQIRLQVPIRDKIPTHVELPFSESAKGVLISATEEADRLGSRTISAQHILLGLVREENCLAQKILMELGVTLETTRQIAAGWSEKGVEPSSFNLHRGVTGRAVPNEEFQRAPLRQCPGVGFLVGGWDIPEQARDGLDLGRCSKEQQRFAQRFTTGGFISGNLRSRLAADI